MRVFLLACAVLSGFGAFGCGQKSKPNQAPAAPASRSAVERTEREFEGVYSGVASSRAVFELAGSIMGTADGSRITSVQIPVTLAQGADPVDLRSIDAVRVSFVSASGMVPELDFAMSERRGNGDEQLDAGETADISVDLGSCAGCDVSPGARFTLEIAPADGGSYLIISRTVPARLVDGEVRFD